jgi:hypothetical protein
MAFVGSGLLNACARTCADFARGGSGRSRVAKDSFRVPTKPACASGGLENVLAGGNSC